MWLIMLGQLLFGDVGDLGVVFGVLGIFSDFMSVLVRHYCLRVPSNLRSRLLG